MKRIVIAVVLSLAVLVLPTGGAQAAPVQPALSNQCFPVVANPYVEQSEYGPLIVFFTQFDCFGGPYNLQGWNAGYAYYPNVPVAAGYEDQNPSYGFSFNTYYPCYPFGSGTSAFQTVGIEDINGVQGVGITSPWVFLNCAPPT